MKTAVVYDKWLHSLGGGEVVAVRVALALSEAGYNVIFIAGKPVSYEKIQERIGVDIRHIPIICIWNDELAVQNATRGKDLFVNVTFMDYTRGKALRNVYYTHFPSDPWYSLRSSMMSTILFPLIKNFFTPVECLEGGEVPSIRAGHLFYKVQDRLTLAFSFLKPYDLYTLKYSLHFEDFSSSNLNSISWSLKKAKIVSTKIRVNHQHNLVRVSHEVIPQAQTIIYTATRRKSTTDASGKISIFNPVCYPAGSMFSFFHRLEWFVANKMRAGIFENVFSRVRTYSKVISNSQFVQKWVYLFWQLQAKVIYPPVSTLKITAATLKKKQKRIVSVGRFFVTGHSKRQDAMISAFKKLYDLGYKEWSLHLVGGLGSEEGSAKYFSELQASTAGYPVFFHLNLPREEVEEQLFAAEIYWHAAGLDERQPAKQEHFGISVVEAISAGCWPIVYNGGGLPEIINKAKLSSRHHLFESQEECVQKTAQLIQHPPATDRLDLSRRMEEAFSTKRFAAQFLQEVESL